MVLNHDEDISRARRVTLTTGKLSARLRVDVPRSESREGNGGMQVQMLPRRSRYVDLSSLTRLR
jgi:hypothetical protein